MSIMKYFKYIFLFMCIRSTHSNSRENHLNSEEKSDDFCDGKNQSPISIIKCEYVEFPELHFHDYWQPKTSEFKLHNTGHSVEVHYPGKPPLLQGGPLEGDYSLFQVHFHWGKTDEGSEHKINSLYYAMEAHLVHYKKEYGGFEFAKKHKNGVAVVAIMFSIAEDNSTDLDSIVNNLHKVIDETSVCSMPHTAMAWLQTYLETPGEYYTYFGSLTTPRCDESVTWIVLKDVATVGSSQLNKFRELMGHNGAAISNNSREIQDFNDRTVRCSPANISHANLSLVLISSILVLTLFYVKE